MISTPLISLLWEERAALPRRLKGNSAIPFSIGNRQIMNKLDSQFNGPVAAQFFDLNGRGSFEKNAGMARCKRVTIL
jgi:hypothetical protein